jgi:hypothetical protein
MVILVGAFLLTVLVVGTAALSGHPLYLIALALVVGCAILVATRRVDGSRLAWTRRGDRR